MAADPLTFLEDAWDILLGPPPARQYRTFNRDFGVSTCWHCRNQLYMGKGGFSYSEVVDPDGHRLRVHKHCQEYAVGDGYSLPPEDSHGG